MFVYFYIYFAHIPAVFHSVPTDWSTKVSTATSKHGTHIFTINFNLLISDTIRHARHTIGIVCIKFIILMISHKAWSYKKLVIVDSNVSVSASVDNIIFPHSAYLYTHLIHYSSYLKHFHLSIRLNEIYVTSIPQSNVRQHQLKALRTCSSHMEPYFSERSVRSNTLRRERPGLHAINSAFSAYSLPEYCPYKTRFRARSPSDSLRQMRSLFRRPFQVFINLI